MMPLAYTHLRSRFRDIQSCGLTDHAFLGLRELGEEPWEEDAKRLCRNRNFFVSYKAEKLALDWIGTSLGKIDDKFREYSILKFNSFLFTSQEKSKEKDQTSNGKELE